MFSLLCGLWQWFLQKEESRSVRFVWDHEQSCYCDFHLDHFAASLQNLHRFKFHFAKRLSRQERRMVLLGVDNAGKTTTLEQLKALFGLKAMAPERRLDIASQT